MNRYEEIQDSLFCLAHKHPLVYCLTNQVAMEWTANLLLAVGASPLMSSAIEEVDDLARNASSLLLNIGTVNAEQARLMLTAGKAMHALGKPIVLDPAGASASQYRLDVANEIIRTCHPDIIRGNASEIAALANHRMEGCGVDSTLEPEMILPAAQQLALQLNCVIVISGETDYITDGQRLEENRYGSRLMTYVTAMGCAESALIAAMTSIEEDPFRAASDTMFLMGFTGQENANLYHAPGSFKMHFLDRLYYA